MGRLKKVIRPIEKNISLPETLVAEVELRLYSEVEGRVPHGSWSKYLTELIKKDIKDQQVPATKVYSFWLLLNGDYANTDGWADFYVSSFKRKPTEAELLVAGVPTEFTESLLEVGEATDGECVTWKLREERLP